MGGYHGFSSIHGMLFGDLTIAEWVFPSDLMGLNGINGGLMGY